MKNIKYQLKYWAIIIICSVALTYLSHFLVRQFWGSNAKNNTLATSLDSLVTMFLLPISLSLLNFLIAKKYNLKYVLFILNCILVLFCVWLSAYFHFENWVDSIKNKSNIDNATIEVIGFTRLIGYIVGGICLFIATLYLKKSQNLLKE